MDAESQSRVLQRLLGTLERLLEQPAVDLRSALNQAAQLIVEALHADKVDAFLLDPTRNALRAMGTSDTPLGRLQTAQGLDFLPISNGGSMVKVYQTGLSCLHGHLDRGQDEVPGLIQVLGLRSQIAVPLEVAGERRGVLSAQSQTPEFFTEEDLRFLQAASRWIGAVAHRAELVEASTAAARASGRREAADELILVLAHDLRNYLNPLMSRIELLRLRAVQQHRPADVRDAEGAVWVLKRLTRLIADLLDVERLEQGIFAVQSLPIELMGLVRETTQTLEVPDVVIQVSGPPHLVLHGDPDRLRQALENLIGNAIKHSPKGKCVQVEVRAEIGPDAVEQAIVEVADQGPGVPPEVLPHLFERFARAGRAQGLGLGLYLASRIAIAHGGTLNVSSLPGKGARFLMVLPMSGCKEDDSSQA